MSSLKPIEIDPKTFLRRHFTLPALPKVVIQIQQMIQGDNVDLGRVAELVRGDPSLLAQVLKVANSAYYGLPREVTKVQFALAFLGLNEIYRMILSLSVINTLAIEANEELDQFWFHSFYTAVCSKYLAKKYEPLVPYDDLWSAAMLHDIGKLVYLKFFPDHYRAIVAQQEKEGCLFSEAERTLQEPSSSMFGGLLCEYWRLPENMRSACECHTLEDLPSLTGDDPASRFRRLIALGNVIAVLAADELHGETKKRIAAVAQKTLGCPEPEFLTMMGDIYELRIEVERFTEQLR